MRRGLSGYTGYYHDEVDCAKISSSCAINGIGADIMAFDLFVAALRCPICGALSPEDSSTDIQTKAAPWVPVFNERRVVAKSKRMGGPDEIYIDPTRVIDYEAIYISK